jgi:hypothetical protein
LAPARKAALPELQRWIWTEAALPEPRWKRSA